MIPIIRSCVKDLKHFVTLNGAEAEVPRPPLHVQFVIRLIRLFLLMNLSEHLQGASVSSIKLVMVKTEAIV